MRALSCCACVTLAKSSQSLLVVQIWVCKIVDNQLHSKFSRFGHIQLQGHLLIVRVRSVIIHRRDSGSIFFFCARDDKKVKWNRGALDVISLLYLCGSLSNSIAFIGQHRHRGIDYSFTRFHLQFLSSTHVLSGDVRCSFC